MIAATRCALSSDLGHGGRRERSPRRWSVTLILAADVVAPAPARAPEPRPFMAELQGLLTDGATLRLPDSARAAARAFNAGNGFLPGQMIDRAI